MFFKLLSRKHIASYVFDMICDESEMLILVHQMLIGGTKYSLNHITPDEVLK